MRGDAARYCIDCVYGPRCDGEGGCQQVDPPRRTDDTVAKTVTVKVSPEIAERLRNADHDEPTRIEDICMEARVLFGGPCRCAELRAAYEAGVDAGREAEENRIMGAAAQLHKVGLLTLHNLTVRAAER